MEAQRHESQSNQAQQDASEGLAKQEQECASEALGPAGVVIDACLDDKPGAAQKDNAPGEHPEAAEAYRDVPLGCAHLSALQVLREIGLVGLEELPQGNDDRDEADDDRHRAAARVDEDGGYRLLGAVARGSG